uniref:Uncharacterized protein n=1 Tax=Grifola frondosa TaxID=5627 RepID=A0A1C7LY74_GRIFR|nr:hypothetical protein A0H81_10344 [Grifola frondosa]
MGYHHFELRVNHLPEAAQVAMLLGVVCRVILGISRRAGDFILNLVALVVYLVSSNRDGSSNPSAEDTLRDIPLSINSALSHFNFSGRTTVYAVCEVCHYTYKPLFLLGSSLPIYAERCTNRPIPGGDVCDHPLLSRTSDDELKPTKTFMYHHFHDYLASLLSRKDMEEYMDQSCDDLLKSQSSPSPDFVKHAFEGEFLRSFPGPSPGTLFIDRQGEGRYAFALHIDFFSPEGMTVRGAKTSCGMISMACLNLPFDIRYKPENMYVAGIVPGPNEPHLDELNHYLRPLVDDLVLSYERGVRFSRTSLHRFGRVTRSTVALVIADLPAARKAAQMAAHSSHFYLLSSINSRRTDLDSPDWQCRDKDVLRRQAEDWKHASNVSERKSLFKVNGVRWSELWRLRYWDPPRQLVVDSMHCIFEGIVENHCRIMLNLTTQSASGPESIIPAFHYPFRTPDVPSGDLFLSQTEVKQVSDIHTLLTLPVNVIHNDVWDVLAHRLSGKNVSALRFVCEDLACIPSNAAKKYKVDWVNSLVEWRKQKPYHSDDLKSVKIATPAVMQRIRDVIRDLITPSWLNSVPHNFGDSAAGTVKADEWRTLITIHLPLALISLWGFDVVGYPPNHSPRLREILDHTMSLVSATTLVSKRVMTRARADAFLENMALYIRDLKVVHPSAKHLPNHHMSLHIHSFLLLFGPFSTTGQLESTMLQSFIQGGKLRRWLARPDCSPAIKECNRLLHKFLSEVNGLDADGSRPNT